MTNFEISLERAKSGNPKIDTPRAASDLYYILHKRFKIKLDTGVIQIRKVDYGSIEFRVRAIIFKFMYKPSDKFRLFYLHLEGVTWQDAHYDDQSKGKSKHLIDLVKKIAITHVPNPI